LSRTRRSWRPPTPCARPTAAGKRTGRGSLNQAGLGYFCRKTARCPRALQDRSKNSSKRPACGFSKPGVCTGPACSPSDRPGRRDEHNQFSLDAGTKRCAARRPMTGCRPRIGVWWSPRPRQSGSTRRMEKFGPVHLIEVRIRCVPPLYDHAADRESRGGVEGNHVRFPLPCRSCVARRRSARNVSCVPNGSQKSW